MNIQIFGKPKCFDTKKAIRYFKERNIKFHNINILEKGLSKGELTSITAAIGGIYDLVSEKSSEYHLFLHLTEEGQREKILLVPSLLKTPIVRNQKQATVGYKPEIWKDWI